MSDEAPKSEIILYQTEDEQTRLQVRLEGETAWLTQAQMAELFQSSVPNVSMHVRNLFSEGELAADSVVKEFLTTAADGKNYRTKFYNLDVIISVGYRVKSLRGTQFRIWATQRLERGAPSPPEATEGVRTEEIRGMGTRADGAARSTAQVPGRRSSHFKHARRAPAHPAPVERFNEPVIVWMTVCTEGRKPILACPEAHDLLREAWATADRWLVGRYLLMPDHVHLFCAPGVSPAVPLMRWVVFWKSYISNHWPREEETVWQRDFWDTQLRRHESYSGKWEYTRMNPVRAGLVKTSEEWPYQGELNQLQW